MKAIESLLEQKEFSEENLVRLLESNSAEAQLLFDHSQKVKIQHVGSSVYLRGLIEYSNICRKNCLYCGIRCANKEVERYSLTEKEVQSAIEFAIEQNYASIVLQSGERQDEAFVKKIAKILQLAKKMSNDLVAITLSCGEQTKEVYRHWFESGASRYLLRIESSVPELYAQIHPQDQVHRFEDRTRALGHLKELGYQVGTGVMIGFPGQTTAHLAKDLLFMQKLDIDMCGMGPYVHSVNTPMSPQPTLAMDESIFLSLKMIALLRILMPDINIAATTALQTLDATARTEALRIGANVLMPTITPLSHRKDYQLYENKAGLYAEPTDSLESMKKMVKMSGGQIKLGISGDSIHYTQRLQN